MARNTAVFHAVFTCCGECGDAGRATLVFALVGVFHEVRHVCAGGIVAGEVGGDEEVGCVEGQILNDARDGFAWGGGFDGVCGGGGGGFWEDAVEDCGFALEEVPSVYHEAGEVARAEVALHNGGDEFSP